MVLNHLIKNSNCHKKMQKKNGKCHHIYYIYNLYIILFNYININITKYIYISWQLLCICHKKCKALIITLKDEKNDALFY